MRRSNGGQQQRNQGSQIIFDDYVPQDVVKEGLLKGTFLQGYLRVTPSNWRIANVSCDGLSVDVCVDRETLRNRAIHGDLVAIELLPDSDWLPVEKKGFGGSLDPPAEDEADNAIQKELWHVKKSLLTEGKPKDSDNADSSSSLSIIVKQCSESSMRPRGKVVYILEQSRVKLIIGTLSASCQAVEGKRLPERETKVLFKPMDNRYPNLVILRSKIPTAYITDPFKQQKHIYQAEIVDNWYNTSKSPQGTNVRSIGLMGCIQDETKALLIGSGLDHPDYSEEILKPLRDMLAESQGHKEHSPEHSDDKIHWTIPEDEIAKRRDLRGYRIFTIDPYNAKDLDDALHITPLEDGTYEIGVHIADVSYFVKEGSLLDIEAKKRATSIYLVQKVIPMLPRILCEQLCSLNPNVDRLAYSCIWRMKADGNRVDEAPYYGRTVIRSCAKLDYATAQRMIDLEIPHTPTAGSNSDAFLASISEEIWESSRRPIGHSAWECANDVIMMNDIAMKRRVIRQSGGALAIGQPKLAFKLDECGNPSALSTYTIRDSNRLVEEYMLLANFLVAEETLNKCGGAAVVRNHSPPDGDVLASVKETAMSDFGVDIDVSDSRAMQESIAILQASCPPAVCSALSTLLMFTLSTAYYIVADEESSNWEHYALNIPYYTHFTSPIRRYADILVHRLLDLGLTNETAARNLYMDGEKLTGVRHTVKHCNAMKGYARTAQEDIDEIYLCAYLKGLNQPMYVDGVVVGTGDKSFSVQLMCLGKTERLFTDKMNFTSPSFNKETRELTLTYDAKERKDDAKVSKFPEMEKEKKMIFSIGVSVVVICVIVEERMNYSLVCVGTCAERGIFDGIFPVIHYQPAVATRVVSQDSELDIEGIAVSLSEQQI